MAGPRSYGRHGRSPPGGGPPPALRAPRAPNLLPYQLIMVFGVVVLPLILVMNNGAVLPVGVLNARCEAAYRASTFPRFRNPGFFFSYGRITPEMSSRNYMTVINLAGPSLQPVDPKRVSLTCATDLNGRIRLKPR